MILPFDTHTLLSFLSAGYVLENPKLDDIVAYVFLKPEFTGDRPYFSTDIEKVVFISDEKAKHVRALAGIFPASRWATEIPFSVSPEVEGEIAQPSSLMKVQYGFNAIAGAIAACSYGLSLLPDDRARRDAIKSAPELEILPWIATEFLGYSEDTHLWLDALRILERVTGEPGPGRNPHAGLVELRKSLNDRTIGSKAPASDEYLSRANAIFSDRVVFEPSKEHSSIADALLLAILRKTPESITDLYLNVGMHPGTYLMACLLAGAANGYSRLTEDCRQDGAPLLDTYLMFNRTRC